MFDSRSNRFEEHLNVFDIHRPKAFIRITSLKKSGQNTTKFPDYLQHYGIPHMKWGFRRFQYKNGRLTPEGKERYGVGSQGQRSTSSESKEVSPEKRKELTDILYKQLRKNSRMDSSAKNLDRDTKTSSGKIASDNDLFIRDRIGGSDFRILKEDLENHHYIVEPRKASNGFAIIQRDGNNVNIASYGPEGLIKQNISGRTIKKLEKALGIQDNDSKQGETKKEQKRREREEWNKQLDEEFAKENEWRDLGKKTGKFDKATPQDQDKILKDVKAKIDELDAKMKKDGGLGHDDDKMRDGLRDWYQQANDKVEKAKKDLADLAIKGNSRQAIRNNPVIQEAAKNSSELLKKYKEANKKAEEAEDAFYNNKELYEKFLNKAVDIAMTEKWFKGEDRKNVYWFYKYEDGDQGPNSSLELFKKSTEGEKYRKVFQEATKLYKDFSKSCKNDISKYLGSYGDQVVHQNSAIKVTALNSLTWEAMRLAEEQNKI